MAPLKEFLDQTVYRDPKPWEVHEGNEYIPLFKKKAAGTGFAKGIFGSNSLHGP